MSLPSPITLKDLSKCTFDGYYTLLKTIGQGAYGTVFRAIENPSQDTVAIKVIRTPELGTFQAELLDIELEALEKMHVLPSLAPLRHIFEEDDFTFIVLDFIDGGDMEDPIMKDRVFVGDNDRVRYIFNRMLIAVQDVHAYGYCHRDIKPANFLATKGLERVYIADFGLCSKTNEPVKDQFGDFGRGTYTHLAPEGFETERESLDSAKSDVYAMAVVLFQMLYGELPWYQSTSDDPCYDFFLNAREEYFNWRDAYAVTINEPGLSSDARSLLMDALNPNMEERLDLYEFDRRFSIIDDFFGSVQRKEQPTEPPSLESVSPFVISNGSDESDESEESEESEEGPTTPEHGLAPLIVREIEEEIVDKAEAPVLRRRRLTIRNGEE